MKRVIKRAITNLTGSSIGPAYLFFALTDLVWGLSVLLGTGFHSDQSIYWLINTPVAGWILTIVGGIGVINFLVTQRWFLVLHTYMNLTFYLYIVIVQVRDGDGAWTRNAVIALLSLWLIFRIQRDYFSKLTDGVN